MEEKKHSSSTESHHQKNTQKTKIPHQSLKSWIGKYRTTIVGSIVLFAGILCFLGMLGIIERLIGSIPYILLFALGLILVYLGLRMLNVTALTGPIDQKITKLRNRFFKK